MSQLNDIKQTNNRDGASIHSESDGQTDSGNHDEVINDWSELQSQWQAYQPDIKKIQKKINWVSWRMALVLTLEVVLVIGYLYFLYYSAVYQENALSIDVWNYFVGILVLIGLYIDFKLRMPLFRLEGNSTQQILALYLKRTQLGFLLGRISKVFCLILLMAFDIWVTINHIYFPEEVKLSSFNFILFGNLWIGLFLFGSIWYQNKKSKEAQKLANLWQDYLN